LPETLIHLAQDIGASEAEISEGAVVERAQLTALARPAVPLAKVPERPFQELRSESGGQRNLLPDSRKCSHTLAFCSEIVTVR